jgi:membrane-associated protein
VLADLTFLTGLHGSIATILICALLVVDEAGVPMWIAPSEVLLIIAGLLIASGAMPLVFFAPLCLLAMFGGSWTGYSWSKAVGSTQLRTLAGRLKGTKVYDRAVRRIGSASTRQIFVARIIPGMRIYATLAAGTAEVEWRQFMRGNIPAIVVWATFFTSVGFAVGYPAVAVLNSVINQFTDLAVSGGLLIVLGVIAYRAIRRAPQMRMAPVSGPFHGIHRRDRYVLAVAVDAGMISVITAGFDRITRYVLHWRLPLLPEKTLFEPLILLAGIAFGYVLVSRRSKTGETAGERLFDVSYVHPRLAADHPDDPTPYTEDDVEPPAAPPAAPEGQTAERP